MKITIIGAGAMGTLFAGFLAKSGNNVAILVKNKKTEKLLKNNGIKIKGLSKVFIPPSKLQITSDPKKISFPEVIMVFVKSYDTISIIPAIKKMMGKDTIVLTLQNGIGNYETISKYLCVPQRILCGTTSESATFIKYGNAIHTGRGETVIGKGRKDISEKITNILNKCGIKTRINDEIESVIWSKLVINCAINPVAAIARVKNGEIIRNKNLEEVAVEAGKEVVKIADSLGIKILFSDVSGKIEKVCTATSKNINSMLADVMAGRETEIDSINGAVVRIADKIGIPVPVNKSLYKIVKCSATE